MKKFIQLFVLALLAACQKAEEATVVEASHEATNVVEVPADEAANAQAK